MRYASITPTGSLNRSNREIWTSRGRDGSSPYSLRTASISAEDRSRFFSLRGSMLGGTRNCGWGSGWANCGMEKMLASYGSTIDRRTFQTGRNGLLMSMWPRQIHFPFLRVAQPQKVRRLGVVDEDDVRLLEDRAEPLEISCVHVLVGFPSLHRNLDVRSLQAVVDRFRDFEKPGGPVDDLPSGIQPQFLHDRGHPFENLRDPSAFPGGVHVNDPDPRQFFPQLAKLAEDGRSDDPFVGAEGNAHFVSSKAERTLASSLRRWGRV